MTTQKQIWTVIVEQNNFKSNENIIIKGDEFHYLVNVLRLKVGDKIEITNCEGYKCLAEIIEINKKEIHLVTLSMTLQKPNQPEVHLYLALPKPSTLEDVVASVSEMGLDEVHVFRSERCVSKAPVKVEKLQRISNEALRISKSAYSTAIFSYENMKEMFDKQKILLESGLNLFCDEAHVYENKVTNALLKILQEKFNSTQHINIFIGPEASFSEREREFILKNLKDCYSVSLGNNILRVPNAVLSALAIVNQMRL